MLLSHILKELGHFSFRGAAINFLKEEVFLGSEVVKKQIKTPGSGVLDPSASLTLTLCSYSLKNSEKISVLQRGRFKTAEEFQNHLRQMK